MRNQEIINILRLIIAKSQSIRDEAVRMIKTLDIDSPIIQRRLNYVASRALDDSSAGFSDGEIAQITRLLSPEDTETRDYTLRVRLTTSERVELERLAAEAGMDLSEYVRSKIFNGSP